MDSGPGDWERFGAVSSDAEQSAFPGMIEISGAVGAGPCLRSPLPPPLSSTTWTTAPCTRTTASAPETPSAVGVRGPAKLPLLLGPPLGP